MIAIADNKQELAIITFQYLIDELMTILLLINVAN